MPRAKNCNVTSSTIEDANEHINKTIQEIDMEIDRLIDDDFGKVFGKESTYAQSIIANKDDVDYWREKLKSEKAKGRNSDSIKIKKFQEKLNQAKKDLSKSVVAQKEIKRKKEIGNRLTELLRDKLTDASTRSAHTLNIPKVVGALKGFLVEKTGVGFVSINQLSYGELKLTYARLKKWFDHQDKVREGKAKVPEGFRGLVNGYQYSLMDPAAVVLANDFSLQGVSLEKEILGVLNKKAAKKVLYKDKNNKIFEELYNFIYEKNIGYFPGKSREEQPQNPNELGSEESVENFDNILELQADLMDGRVKYIIPQPQAPLFLKEGQKIINKTMINYNKIVSYANKSGFNVSRDIHDVDFEGEKYYYVTMKETNESTGEEIYNAYLVPHYIDSNGRTKFYYPLTRKGGLNGKWVKEMNKFKDNKLDLPDIMTEGFREAQIEKIFNGYNKQDREINVKGYANYTKMDLSRNHELFKEKRVRTGSKSQNVVSLWTSIRDTRKLLADIFTDFQDISQATLKRIEKTSATYPQVKNALVNRGYSKQESNDYISEALNIVDFSQMIFVNKNGQIESPNITSGIDENYHPNMFESVVRWSDLFKAINGMENELDLAKDRLVQLDYQLNNAQTPEEKRKVSSQIISTKNTINDLEGYEVSTKDGVERVPGLIETMKLQLDQELGIIAPEDMPKVPLQSMVKYAKHRKLYTNLLKDPDPNVKFGGRRKDASVINDYIENVFETVYNNELKAGLLESLPIVDTPMMNYLIEEVKAATGRRDVKAGLPYIDYSNDKVMKTVRKLFPNTKMTEAKLQERAVWINSIISGALLSSFRVSSTNWMQSVFSSMIETQPHIEARVAEILNNQPEYATEIAQKTGALDSVQAVADVFLGGLESQVDLMDGFHSKKDLALLAGQNMMAFINGATGIRQQMIKLMKRRPGSKGTVSQEQLSLVMEGIWEFVHGIAEGTITTAKLKAIEKKLVSINASANVRVYAGWGLNAFGIGKSVIEAKPLTPYLSMIQGEYEMRRIMAVRGAVLYADYLGDIENRGNYLHPDALNHARIVINSTMFQFSLQHFGKAYRGAIGASTMKFKNYFNKQLKREGEILKNVYLRWKGEPSSRILQEMIKIFTPTTTMPVPFLSRLIGKESQDVGTFNPKEKGPFPYMELPIGRGTDYTIEAARQFLWGRALASVFAVTLTNVSLIRKFKRYVSQKTPFDVSSVTRGGESVSVSLGLRILQLGLGTLFLYNDDDEYNEDLEQIYRLFVPLWLNVGIDFMVRQDPFRVFRIVGGWGSELGEYILGRES